MSLSFHYHCFPVIHFELSFCSNLIFNNVYILQPVLKTPENVTTSSP